MSGQVHKWVVLWSFYILPLLLNWRRAGDEGEFPHPGPLPMGEGTIKQKGCGECTTARNNKDNFYLWTVIRRTTTREFPSGIWEEDQCAEDKLRHAVRSFLRICLIAKRVYTVRAKCVKVYLQDCSAYPWDCFAYNENHDSNLEYSAQAKQRT